MLKLSAKVWEATRYLYSLKISPPGHSLIRNGEIAALQWRNSTDTTFTKWWRLTALGRRQDYLSLIMMCDGHIISVIFRRDACIQYAQMHSLNLIMRRHQTNPNKGTFSRTTNLYSSNVSNLWKTRTDWGTSTNWGRLRRLDKCKWDPALDPGPQNECRCKN